MKRILTPFFLLLLLAPPSMAQVLSDGCMNVRTVVTRSWNEEFEDPFFNDESNWRWWFADNANLDGTGWVGGTCLAQGGFFQIGWWNHGDVTVFNRQYGTPGGNLAIDVPQFLNLRGAYEGDDCGGSCDGCTSNPFDNDDYRYDQTVSTNINYRFAAPNSNNFFQRFTSWNGSSDFGGEFYARYTSPRPTSATANPSTICSTSGSSSTLSAGGAIFGGQYVWYDATGSTVLGVGPTLNVTPSSTTTYRVYTRNGGTLSQCYNEVTVSVVTCSPNCVSKSYTGGTVSVDADEVALSSVSFTPGTDFPAGSLIEDVNVTIEWTKTDGSCGSPGSGGAFHNETAFELSGPTGCSSVSLVETGDYSGGTDIGTVTTLFDQDAPSGVSGTPTSGSFLPAGNLDGCIGASPFGGWTIIAGDNVGADPLCVFDYTVQICVCVPPTSPVAASATPNTVCETGGGTIELNATGGSGDELHWFTGSCGSSGPFAVTTGSTPVFVPSPTTTTTYYARWYSGTTCGYSPGCASVTVNVDGSSVAGTISGGTSPICEGDAPGIMTLSGNTGSVVRWERSNDGGATFTPLAGTAGATTYTSPPLNTPGDYLFQAVVQNGVCDEVVTPSIVIEVQPVSTFGSTGATATTICSGDSTTLFVSGANGSIQWQESTDGVLFTDIAGATFDTYEAAGLTNTGTTDETVFFQAVITNPPCSPVATGVTAITVQPESDGGTVSADQDICSGDVPGDISASGFLGSFVNWQRDTDPAFSAPVDFGFGTPTVLGTAIGPLTTTTYFRGIVQNGVCPAVFTPTIAVNVFEEPTNSITADQTICIGDVPTPLDGSTPTLGTGSYTYHWQLRPLASGTFTDIAGATSEDYAPGALTASTLFRRVVTSGPCQSTSNEVRIDVVAFPTITSVSSDDVLCFGDSTGSITITSPGSVTYSIDSGASFQVANTFDDLPAGNYNVAVQNPTGCTTFYGVNPVVIDEPDSLDVSLVTVDPNCASTNDGSITVNVTGGQSPYEYALNGGSYQSGNAFTGLSAGAYTVTVRDDHNCIKTVSATLVDQYIMTLAIDSARDVSCPGAGDGYVELLASGGVAPYEYSIDGVNYQSGNVYSGLTSGNYTFYALDDNGCLETVNIVLIEGAPITIAVDSVDHVACAGDSDGAIFVTASGSVPPYSYEWSQGGSVIATTEDISGLAAGTYNLVVSTSSSCSESVTVTIDEPAPLDASITDVTDVDCAGASNGSISVSATGGVTPYSYAWTGGVSTTNSATGLSGGTYDVTITDANGCDTVLSATIAEPSLLAFTTTDVDPSCANSNDGSITVNAVGGTPGYSYSIDGGALQASNAFGSLSAGTYTIRVVDANGCETTSTVTLTDTYTLTLGASSITDVSCSGASDGEVVLNPIGGVAPFTYLINGSSPQGSATFSGLSAGFYTFTAIDDNGCSADTSLTIGENPPLVLNLDSTRDVLCAGDATGGVWISVVGGTVPYTYAWTGGSTSEDNINIAAGTYTVTVTDANGCTATLSATIGEPTALDANVTSTTDVSCLGAADGAMSVSATGGVTPYSYAWTGGVSTTNSATGLSGGTYDVTITDANGCDTVLSATIAEPSLLAFTTTDVDPSCANSNDGSITVNAVGGTPGYSYSIDGGALQASNAFGSLSAGTYTIRVVDANGCETTSTVTLTDTYTLTLGASSITDVSCSGASDGEVVLNPIGGVAPFTYLINGSSPQGSATFSGLSAGFYTFTAIDDNGCSADTSLTIGENPPLVLNLDSTRDVLCAGDATGGVWISVVGGTVPYTYAWTGGSTSEDNINIAAGSYNVTVTDDNGCTATLSATIGEPTALDASVTSTTDVSCLGAADGAMSVSATGGVTPYSYAWTGGVSTTNSATGLSGGTYDVTITDANGCDTVVSATIAEPSLLAFTTTDVDPSCANSNDGSITVNAVGGTPGYSYSIDGGALQASNAFGSLSAGAYTIRVVDANGCETTSTVTLTDTYTLTLGASSITDVSCSGASDGEVVLNPIGGVAPFTYLINGSSPQGSATFSGLSAGFYTFTAIDDNGCSADTSLTIGENPPLVLNLDSTRDVLCAGDATGGVWISVVGGTVPYTYAWTGGSTSEDNINIAAGTYTVTVTDANGCTATLSAIIGEPEPLGVTLASAVNILCASDSTGQIDITVNGGTSPYTFVWQDAFGATIGSSEDLLNLPAGTYDVVVTDDNGCTATLSHTLTEPTDLTGSITVEDVRCFDDNDGKAWVTASGGVPPYTYLWNTGATADTIFNMAPGVIFVEVFDANGCSVFLQDTIDGPDNDFDFDLETENVLCAGDSTGTATLTMNGGGSPPYTITFLPWVITTTPVDTGETVTQTGIPAGNYFWDITDNNGCKTIVPFEITEPDPILTTTSATEPDCFGQENGLATVGVSGGTPPYTYEWSTTPTQTGLVAVNLFGNETYTVTVTDFNGCTAIDSVFVPEKDSIAISITATDVACLSGEDGEAVVSVTGGNPPYNYQLNGVWQPDSILTGLTAGTYQVVVQDNYGCLGYANFEVLPASSLDVELFADGRSDQLNVLVDQEVQLLADTLNGDSIVNILSYIWEPTEVDLSGCADPTLCPDPVIAPSGDVTVVVGVEFEYNGNVCILYDSIDITTDGESIPFIPTAFSPNGDGVNDCFAMNVLGAENLAVTIFNRWGEDIYHNPDQQNGPSGATQDEIVTALNDYCRTSGDAWDGTYKGEPVPTGAYVYQVVVTYPDGTTEVLNGTVSVVR